MTELRPYQSEARQAIENEWASGVKNTLLVLPTGTGKTVVFSKVIEDQVRSGDRCLIMAHRGELLDQAADKLKKISGLGCSIEKADQSCLGEWYRVCVGSVQSLQRPQRLQKFSADYFNTIIIDEAHHWVKVEGQYAMRCTNCGSAIATTKRENCPDFCFRCHADMRKNGSPEKGVWSMKEAEE